MKEKTYIAIDLKSFYASVECIERGLNPLRTNLVVADESRTSKTICLAVTPSLKARGVPARPRLFEVEQIVKILNAKRRSKLRKDFEVFSYDTEELEKHSEYGFDYIVALPRMAKYIEYSTKIYEIYLRYVAKEDIHVYSIDEVFMDVSGYLHLHNNSPVEMVKSILKDVINETGITATAGIGTNLYLAKIAMDIVAKHIPPDKDGFRIADLDVMKYRKLLWSHEPINDFWRIGQGYARQLNKKGIFTMGDVARCSLDSEDFLYKLFGVNAELLIDHAWGYEPTTISEIKNYKPESKSMGVGQVLHRPYSYEDAGLITWEMTEQLSLNLLSKGFLTNQLVLTVGYDIENLLDKDKEREYKGEVKFDSYGRKKPKSAHGTVNLDQFTVSTRRLTDAMMNLYSRIVDPKLTVRRITISANKLINSDELKEESRPVQMDFFCENPEPYGKEDEKEIKIQETLLKIKARYGKSAIFKLSNLFDGATALDRNRQIGGHRA